MTDAGFIAYFDLVLITIGYLMLNHYLNQLERRVHDLETSMKKADDEKGRT
jgi:hypothetical protein